MGNLKKELKCDDECARLERNRKLALALDIDPATHTDNHVPYSAETLKMFSTSSKWCSDQEREFRVFASDENERRLRFKPMGAEQRAFIHSLAEDFGLDSESMDPEPHRHVAIFKTPRFVSAPSKSVRDAWRIRQNQLREEGREMVAYAQAKAEAEAKAKQTSEDPYNGYLLRQPRFALTEDEILAALAGAQSNSSSSVIGPDSNLDFHVHFLPSENVALIASFHLQPPGDSSRLLERTLEDSKASYARGLVSQHKVGASLDLARFDDSLNIVRRGDMHVSSKSSGWSQVAAKAAAPRQAPAVNGIGQKSGFAVLQSAGNITSTAKSKAQAKKEKKKERKGSVADDWEMELEKDEAELQKAILGTSNTGDAAIDSCTDSGKETYVDNSQTSQGISSGESTLHVQSYEDGSSNSNTVAPSVVLRQ